MTNTLPLIDRPSTLHNINLEDKLINPVGLFIKKYKGNGGNSCTGVGNSTSSINSFKVKKKVFGTKKLSKKQRKLK